MHSAIFTVVEIPDEKVGNKEFYDGLKENIPSPCADDLYEDMRGHADYVRDTGNGWDAEDLIDYLAHDYRDLITIVDKDNSVFALTKKPMIIRKELQKKIDGTQRILDDSDDLDLAYYEMKDRLNSTNGYWINVVDNDLNDYGLYTLDDFLFDGWIQGKTYMIVHINDYHN